MSTAPEIWVPGAPLAAREELASEVDLFRFSAATWNAHRIHYDAELARAEGLPATVVQAHLHGAWLARLARSVAGPQARLRELSWRNRAAVAAGERVRLTGEIAGVRDEGGERLLELALREQTPAGELRVEGRALVAVGAEAAR